MQTHGQFCAVARALELLGDRWTLLVVRELLLGSTRFSELKAGIPLVSRTMLTARLASLTDAGVIVRSRATTGPVYTLTEAGRALEPVVMGLGVWAQRHARWPLREEELDIDVLLFDMRRRIAKEKLPARPLVLVLELTDLPRAHRRRFLLLRREEVSLCEHNPGFPAEVTLTSTVRALTAYWRGDISWRDAVRAGEIALSGPSALVRALPGCFERYVLADVSAA